MADSSYEKGLTELTKMKVRISLIWKASEADNLKNSDLLSLLPYEYDKLVSHLLSKYLLRKLGVSGSRLEGGIKTAWLIDSWKQDRIDGKAPVGNTRR